MARSEVPAEPAGPRDQATLEGPRSLPVPAVVAQAPAALPPKPAAPAQNLGPVALLEEARTHENRDPEFVENYGPWALVTGASQGIGAEFARQLAEKGMNVILVARNAEKLEGLARDLQADHGVQVRAVPADLSQPGFLDGLKLATRDVEVGMLVNNAGSWEMGSFLDQDPEKELKVIRVNVEAPMLLTHEFAGKMAERGRGGVINVGSASALHGVPGQANYSATKGYMLNLTESLYHELKPQGVDVEIVNPGPVLGEASRAAYDIDKIPMQQVTAGEVVEHALDKLGKKCSTTPGWFNRAALWLALRVLPRDVNAAIAGALLERAHK